MSSYDPVRGIDKIVLYTTNITLHGVCLLRPPPLFESNLVNRTPNDYQVPMTPPLSTTCTTPICTDGLEVPFLFSLHRKIDLVGLLGNDSYSCIIYSHINQPRSLLPLYLLISSPQRTCGSISKDYLRILYLHFGTLTCPRCRSHSSSRALVFGPPVRTSSVSPRLLIIESPSSSRVLGPPSPFA